MSILIRGNRSDRPSIPAGALVWWRTGLYAVDSLELQGQEWTAVLVRPTERGMSGVPCWFAPCRELQVEERA